MNKKPILFRLIFALVVLFVFAASMYPLKQRDFYKTFRGKLIKEDENIKKVFDLAEGKQEADALKQTVKELDVDLAKYVKIEGITDNRDINNSNVIKLVLERLTNSFTTSKPHRNFYEILDELVSQKDDTIKKVVSLAKSRPKNLYASIAIDEAAQELNVDLIKYVKAKNLTCNRDVISFIREQSSGSIRLGLDLNGGVEFLLELKPKAEEKGEEKSERDFKRDRDAAIEILRNRLESEKIFESEISPVGGKYISLKAPIVSKEEKERLLNLIKRAAKLQFRLVHKDNDSLVQQYKADPKMTPLEYEPLEMIERTSDNKTERKICFVKIKPEMSGTSVKNAFPSRDQYGQILISLEFDGQGVKDFGRVTRENVGRQLAIVLDGTLYSAPVIKQAIEGGRAQITGNFSRDEAEEISTALISGSLPVELNVEAVFDTDPTLGAEEVKTSTIAGIISLLLVGVFMVGYYFKAGLVANVALLANVVLILGSLAAFEATLTLPGIAGIILTIGMAVDANVLINERIREELENHKTLPVAIDAGYDRAFLTILDSNLTTLMTAVILMWLGSGAIKGFGVSLSIGIITSMFTAIFITRLIFDIWLRYGGLKTLKMLRFFANPNYNFLGVSHIVLTASAVLIVASLVLTAIRGKECLSIDFTGGTRVTYDYEKHVSEKNINEVLTNAGYKNAKISYKTNMLENTKKLEIILRDRDISKESNSISPKQSIASVFNKNLPELKIHGGDESSLGGLIGMEFLKISIFALIMSIVGMIIYIALRFEFSYGMAAIIAIIHDVIISWGIYLFMGGEMSLNVVGAVLTIIGYSVNDTIVVFDRVREDLRLIKNKSYNEIINLSINQTLSRTLLTGVTTLMVLVILLLAGGTSIRDFILVMFIGIIVGTYSSFFIACPIVSVWHKRSGITAKI